MRAILLACKFLLHTAALGRRQKDVDVLNGEGLPHGLCNLDSRLHAISGTPSHQPQLIAQPAAALHWGERPVSASEDFAEQDCTACFMPTHRLAASQKAMASMELIMSSMDTEVGEAPSWRPWHVLK